MPSRKVTKSNCPNPIRRRWRELLVLLKYEQHVDDKLFEACADRRAESTRDAHRVPAATIRCWMKSWRGDLTVAEILEG